MVIDTRYINSLLRQANNNSGLLFEKLVFCTTKILTTTFLSSKKNKKNCLKLVSAIFYQISIFFYQMIALQKL